MITMKHKFVSFRVIVDNSGCLRVALALMAPAILAVLLTLVGISVAQAAEGGDPQAQLRGMLGRLQGQVGSDVFNTVANEVGPIIDTVRETKMTSQQLIVIRDLVENMREATARRLSEIEAEANDSEAALETLYRSRVWDDLSFALGAFPYWRAWVDLELARPYTDKGQKIQALLPAQKGFRAASMQLFRPGLVYGGWLGLGFCELELGRTDRATKIFQNLDKALAAEPDSPIKEAVSLELRMLEAKQGKVTGIRRAGGAVDTNELPLLKTEAFALLQDSRKTGGRPLLAAERLKAIIDAGRIDQELLQSMLTYAQELSGVDIGAYTDLAGAEFALANENYYDAMKKYERFFNEVVAPPGLDLSGYRYRWAVAAYKQGIYQPAIDILEQLLRAPALPDDVDQAASKLLYAVHASRDARSNSPTSRQQLRNAAQRFVSKNPNDTDADAARMMIAQTAPDAKIALQQLSEIKSSKYKGEVERTAFQIAARAFSDKIARGASSAATGAAQQGIMAFQRLPAEDKQDPFNFALLLQMRALVDSKPADVIAALDEIEKKGVSNLDIRRALVWSRLKLFDRMQAPEQALAYIKSLADKGIESWQIEYLYPWITERKDIEQRLAYARLLQPGVTDQPEMDRRLRGLIIESLMAQELAQEAYDAAHDFAKNFPSSGNAWKLLAQTAEKASQPFEADKAWSVITGKAAPAMPVWWEGMLGRARIRMASGRPEQACELLTQMVTQRAFVPAEYSKDFARLEANPECAVRASAQ